MTHKRRGRVTIIAKILRIAKEGTPKTQIMYGANLSFSQLKEYLSFLLEVKLVKTHTEDRRTLYKITPKGLKYLRSFTKIKQLLKNDGKNNTK